MFGSGAHVRCTGKGRKERITPLTKMTASVLQAWTDEQGGQSDDPLFPRSHRTTALSRYAVTALVARHVETAANR